MKILYLHQYFNTPDMPGGTRSFEMARRFVERGHTVEMITSYRDPLETNEWFETNEAGINVHWLPVAYSNHYSFLKRLRAFFRFALKASTRAASLNGDVIFATSTPLTIALPAVYAKKRLNVPMIFEVRDLWPELPIAIGALKRKPEIVAAKWLERFAYDKSDHVVALSPGMKDGVCRTGYSPKSVTVIPNSCDVDLFNDPELDGEKFRASYDWLGKRPLVVYTGTLGHINGVDFLVDVANQMLEINAEVRFLIVGDGVELEKVRNRAIETGTLNMNLFIKPQVTKKEIATIIKTADVATSLFVDLKEMWANSANKFFDALAAGKPVMINYGGWQADLIKNNQIGIVVKPNEPKKAAIQLSQLLSNEKRLLQYSEASYELGRSQFNRDKLAENLLKVLEDAVNYEKI